MDVYFLDKNLQVYALLDVYQSFIWTEKYSEPGDFELYAPVTSELVDICKIGNYLSIGSSSRLMIIKSVKIESVFDDADHIVVTGSSLESILDQRIVWDLLTYEGSTQSFIEQILNDAIINPSDANRRIDNFRFVASEDPAITDLTINIQCLGQSLLDIIKSICDENNIGFKVEFQNGDFVFSLYSGIDRSYNQTDNSYVIFSTEYENLKSSYYLEDATLNKTICLVGGEGEGINKKFAFVDLGGTGIDRNEIYKDASSVSSKIDSSTTLSDDDYELLLQYEGIDVLANSHETTTFEGEYSEGTNYIYDRDFYLGDIVEITDPYGHEQMVRIKEWIKSDEDGVFSQYPTFEAVIQQEDEETEEENEQS